MHGIVTPNLPPAKKNALIDCANAAVDSIE